MCAAPTFSVQLIDLDQHRIIPLGRSAPFPDAQQGAFFHFRDTTEDDIEGLKRQGIAMASVLGWAMSPTETQGRGAWLISDPAHASFGTAVPEEALGDPDLIVARGVTGMAYLDFVPLPITTLDSKS